MCQYFCTSLIFLILSVHNVPKWMPIKNVLICESVVARINSQFHYIKSKYILWRSWFYIFFKRAVNSHLVFKFLQRSPLLLIFYKPVEWHTPVSFASILFLRESAQINVVFNICLVSCQQNEMSLWSA